MFSKITLARRLEFQFFAGLALAMDFFKRRKPQNRRNARTVFRIFCVFRGFNFFVRGASCPKSQRVRIIQPQRIEDNPRSDRIKTSRE
jgi:hypothetical protein